MIQRGKLSSNCSVSSNKVLTLVGVELAFFLITVGTGTVFVAGLIGGGLGISFTTAFRNKIDQRYKLLNATASPSFLVSPLMQPFLDEVSVQSLSIY